MNKIITIILILQFFSLTSVLHAKRLPSAEVKPVSKDGIQYSACGDSICATDEKTGEQLWKKQIYVVKYVPLLEKDVQWCFINKIELKDDKLKITNEKGYLYELDLSTLEVKVLKGSLLIDRAKDFKKTSNH